MRRDLPALEATEFDLVVVGGGMFGAAAALDAAQRGLRTALIERADFAGATSSHSFKMVHGGIRYLQHADLPRLRHSARARSAFLRSAPHLVRPLPIVVPTYGKGMKSKPVLRVGLGAYDLLTADRNRGIADPSRRIPRGVFLSGEETRRRYPGLTQQGLTGAGIFCDGQMYNPPRLVLAYVQSAAALGAVCANYVEATGLIERGGQVQGVLARDTAGDGRIEIRSRFVLNAAGPYAEWILAGSLGRGLTPPTPFSRDAYFIVRRQLIEGDHALTVPAITTDRDAIVSRGGRHLFLVPWRGVTLVGVWHKVHQGHPDTYEITQSELEGWIAEVNGAYGGLDLTLADVALGSAGLVPYGESDPNVTELKFAHRSRLVDHRAERGLDGLLTLIGVRYTTGPVEAAEAIGMVGQRLDRQLPPSRVEWLPVHGGSFSDFETLVADLSRTAPEGVSRASARALAHNHGNAAPTVLALATERADWAKTLPDSEVLGAEIAHAAREEMSLTLADAVFRRTDLSTTGHPGDAALRAAARIMGECLGWDESRVEGEYAYVQSRLALAPSGRALLAEPRMARSLVA